MKRVLALLAIGALAPMIQGAIGTFIPLRYCPDLGLLLVVGLGLCWRSTAGGIALSATLGLIADLLSGSLLGQHMLLRIFAFGAARACSRQLNLRGVIPRAIFVMGLTVVTALGTGALTAFFGAGRGGGRRDVARAGSARADQRRIRAPRCVARRADHELAQ